MFRASRVRGSGGFIPVCTGNDVYFLCCPMWSEPCISLPEPSSVIDRIDCQHCIAHMHGMGALQSNSQDKHRNCRRQLSHSWDNHFDDFEHPQLSAEVAPNYSAGLPSMRSFRVSGVCGKRQRPKGRRRFRAAKHAPHPCLPSIPYP